MGKISWGKLIISLAIPFFAAVIGSSFTFEAIPTWYATLQKPPLSPPNWIFGPVWTIIYLLMGLSFYLLWTQKTKRKKEKKGTAIELFLIQLTLNALWSILFFGLQNPFFALIGILFLWAAILSTIIYFYKISKPAAYLLYPYLLWVSFAAYLNFVIWKIN